MSRKSQTETANDFAYIDDPKRLAELLEGVRRSGCSRCAIDTEADSLHCYEEKLCLIQFAAGGTFAIIDPLAIDDLSPLVEYLESTEVWLHGADFDMRMLRRAFDWIPKTIYDTQTAARLLGATKFGLANLVEGQFGVVLPKGSQKADWGKRPLPDKMLEYAVNDVRYLLPMAERLVAELNGKQRWSWFLESCDAARSSALERTGKDEDLVWRISGWGRLERRGMAFLKALWWWRDGEAARRDRPAFKIIGNDQLLAMAKDLFAGKEVSLPPRFPRGVVRRFQEAIARAANLPKQEWPEGPKRQRSKRDPNFESRFDQLKAIRDAAAGDLGIDPTLIGSRSTLEMIAGDPAKGEESLLSWQQELLQPALRNLQVDLADGG